VRRSPLVTKRAPSIPSSSAWQNAQALIHRDARFGHLLHERASVTWSAPPPRGRRRYLVAASAPSFTAMPSDHSAPATPMPITVPACATPRAPPPASILNFFFFSVTRRRRAIRSRRIARDQAAPCRTTPWMRRAQGAGPPSSVEGLPPPPPPPRTQQLLLRRGPPGTSRDESATLQRSRIRRRRICAAEHGRVAAAINESRETA